MKKIFCLVNCIIFLFISTAVFAGPKGVVVVRLLGSNIKITIDGQFDDWPLKSYEGPSIQPLFPEGQESEKTDARGDYIIYDPDRSGFFNSARGAVSEDDPNTDFEVNTYFAYDSDYLYILSVFVDDEISDAFDSTEFGSQPYLNDGQEYFFDSLNDSYDNIAEISFPNVDPEEPNLEDFQIGTGLNLSIDPVLPFDKGGEGIANGIIRAHPDVVGAGNFSDGLYQAKLKETSGPDIAAKMYGDLRAAGAPNPVIAENPTINFAGYTIEQRIPFGFIKEFSPDHDMGFTIFWRDVDESVSAGAIQFIDWAQSTEANGGTNDAGLLPDIFYAPNWGKLEFNKTKPLGESTQVREWSIF